MFKKAINLILQNEKKVKYKIKYTFAKIGEQQHRSYSKLHGSTLKE